MASPAKEVQMLAKQDVANMQSALVALSSDASVDTTKLAALIDLHTQTQQRMAKQAFFAAFAEMQLELPTVYRSGRGHNGVTYAKNDEVQDAIRPVLSKHGFSLSFRTEFPDKLVKITAVLAHRDGHDERTEFVAAADTTGSKNAIQALGSTVSYGKRYTTGALLNITTTDEKDDDGQGSERAYPPNYEDTWIALEDAAKEGFTALQAAWTAADKGVKAFISKHESNRWEATKRTAQKAGK